MQCHEVDYEIIGDDMQLVEVELEEVEAQLEFEVLELEAVGVRLLEGQSGLDREVVGDPVLVLELLHEVVGLQRPEGARLDLVLALVGEPSVAAEREVALVRARDDRRWLLVAGLAMGGAAAMRAAFEALERSGHAYAIVDAVADEDLLALDARVTDCNSAFFDVAHDFAGCIPGCHEVLRRQGLLEGIWCLDPKETLSPG